MLLGLAPRHPAGLDHLGSSGRAEILATYPTQSTALPDIRGLAGAARSIDVLAVRGLGILGLNDSMLRATIQASRSAVTALLLDPECEAAQRRAAEIGESFGSFAAGIRLSVERLRELHEQTGTVTCYLYSILPTWRVIGLDSTLFVSAFGEAFRLRRSLLRSSRPSLDPRRARAARSHRDRRRWAQPHRAHLQGTGG
jgi:hypothetical protein